MDDESLAFLNETVAPLEEELLAHEIGQLFVGELYLTETEPLQELRLGDFGSGRLVLDPASTGRLFFAPDGSLISANALEEQDDGTPKGVYVLSSNPFVQDGEDTSVVAYQDDFGAELRVASLHVRNVMLDDDAPQYFASIAFGLMACTAFRLGFRRITLFAAGRGKAEPFEEDDLVGFLVWPKFGFNADLERVDLQQAPQHLQRCRNVLEVVGADSEWWKRHGSGREMAFDLTANSASWSVLVDYLRKVMLDDQLEAGQ